MMEGNIINSSTLCLLGFSLFCLVPLIILVIFGFASKRQIHKLKPFLDTIIMPDLDKVEEKLSIIKANNPEMPTPALAQKIVNQQALKSSGIGFIIGLGGLITVPINVGASVRNQAETIQLVTAAYGHTFTPEEAKNMTYIILSGQQGIDAMSPALARALQRLLLRLLGRTILRAFVESLPIFGAFVGAGLNYIFTKFVAGPIAIKWCQQQQNTNEPNLIYSKEQNYVQ